MASLALLFAPATSAITGTLFLASYLLYKWLLPKPIPGIPYNPEAPTSLFGDIPAMIKHANESPEIINWFSNQNKRHASPIVQVFTSLFGRPAVVINDYRETVDILQRRSAEFDKPDALTDVLYGIAPNFHARFTKGDAWRSHRKLLQDLMTPAFLHGVAAPQVYQSFLDTTKLWSEKMRLSEGHAFAVKQDIFYTGLEAIWAAVFGTNPATVTRNQIDLLSRKEQIHLPASLDQAAEFPQASAPPEFHAILELTESIEKVGRSPFPKTLGFVQRWLPAGFRNLRIKEHFTRAEIAKAEVRMVSQDDDVKVSNAVDHMLRREKLAAEKSHRRPAYQTKDMQDELLGLLIAGHDTTATVLSWGVKFLEQNQAAQQKLRLELFRNTSSLAAAHAESRIPTAHEIATCQNHYLDAVIEETLRCACTAGFLSRTSLTDTTILGHAIPKGTRIFCIGAGTLGVNHPAYPIDDSLRSVSSGSGKTRSWNEADMAHFDPSRWLAPDPVSGALIFDPHAGPHIAFGAGPRGCFGRKLARLELRLALVLIVWQFALRPVGPAYAGMQARDQLTHNPIHCYVRLEKA
ncbi:hypothetical protein ACEQ8H_001473 [Pleosporales sp. CAS-2024a]